MAPRRRVAYLDNLRILLTILVIVHHAAANYSGPNVWYYNEPVSGPVSAVVLLVLMAVNQAFFMGFFFFLAGYFVPPSLARKGARAFAADRLLRLGVPLVAYFLVIQPLVCRLAGVDPWRSNPGPMWFVEVLLIFTLAYVAVQPLLPAPRPDQLTGGTTALLALGMSAGTFLVRIWYPVNAWLPFPNLQPAHAVQYATLFALGACMSSSDPADGLTPALTRRWRWAMLAAAFPAALAFWSTDVPGDGRTDLTPLIGGWGWQSLATAAWEQVFAVGLILNLLREFHERWNSAGPVLTAAATSTYTVYVIHPIVVVALALALRDVPIPSLAKVAVIVPIAVIVLFTSADYIRRAPLLRRVL